MAIYSKTILVDLPCYGSLRDLVVLSRNALDSLLGCAMCNMARDADIRIDLIEIGLDQTWNAAANDE